jgi:hypothetical protein
MRSVNSRTRARRPLGRRAASMAGSGVAVCAALTAAAVCGPAEAATSHPAPTTSAARPATRHAARRDATSAARFTGGTDSTGVGVAGTGPYQTLGTGGSDGGYIGMAGNWANWQGCGGGLVFSSSDASAAETNHTTYHTGIGVGTYWFMGGPGVDPHFDGRDAEAAAWGARQAAAALADVQSLNPHPDYPVLFMDVELPGSAPAFTPAPDNGWTSVYTSPCSGVVRHHGINPQVDRAEFNGFAGYLSAHSGFAAGVYSAPRSWHRIFGRYDTLRRTYEWTYQGESSNLGHVPDGWCLPAGGPCARFFGGMRATSKYAVMWQWSGGGGTSNGYGDFDQIDVARTP